MHYYLESPCSTERTVRLRRPAKRCAAAACGYAIQGVHISYPKKWNGSPELTSQTKFNHWKGIT